MTNLVPEQRFDKNGRLVTRHIRSTKDILFGKSGMPAPVPHSYDATTAINDYVQVLSDFGIDSSDITEMASGIRRVNEETRILVTAALHECPDTVALLALSHALATKDEQYIRSITLSLEYCSGYARAIADRDSRGATDPARSYRNVFDSFHSLHKSMNRSSAPFEVSSYNPERDKYIADTFKAEHLTDHMNTARKVPLKFELYKHISMLFDNMDAVEKASYACVEVKTALRHYALKNKKSTDAISLDAHDVLAIAAIASDYPHANDKLYDAIIDHGSFDPDRIKLALENDASALIQGVL